MLSLSMGADTTTDLTDTVTGGGSNGSVPPSPPADLPLDRVAKALAFVNRDGRGLEIGPSFRPIAPKRDGFNVHSVDHLPTDELRAKYESHPGVDVAAIEDVDFVWHGESLVELVGTESAYDWIIASHALEHIPDPVSFLIGCERVLRPGGVISLVLPDKRYCFDHFRPLSTTGALLDAFHERRGRPTPGNVFDHMANAVHRGGMISWEVGESQPLALVHQTNEVQQAWETASQTDNYLDVHVWTFVPESFRLLVSDLSMLGITSLGIEGEFDGGEEFFVSLSAKVKKGSSDRLGALRALNPEPNETPIELPEEETSHDDGVALMQVSRREQILLHGKRRAMEGIRSQARSLSRYGRSVVGNRGGRAS